jgi:TonB-dependent receptor
MRSTIHSTRSTVKCGTLLRLFIFAAAIFLTAAAHAATIKGKITDANQEALVGAHVIVTGQKQYGIAGLDGSYTISGLGAGTYTLSISFVGYKSITREVTVNENDIIQLPITLEAEHLALDEVTITAKAEGGSDAQARALERASASTMNIMSAKAISLTPDISVANVIQRVSGLSVERNSNGDPQYAIVRGMDKRYSYTLINGFKVPSPDNKNRYVPLDIFPAALLERLEVYKSLTADQEGDAIGGGINMVMKNAPENPEIKGDFQIGYNYINILDGFDRYNSKVVSSQSPREKYGDAYQAQPSDFTKKNLEVTNVKPMPDLLGSLSLGNRFFGNRLGVMIGASYQNSYRGTKSYWFDFDTDRSGSNLPSLRSVQDRHYSTQQQRGAFHARLDYRFNSRHEIKLYTGYYSLNNLEARQIRETYVDGRGYDPNTGNAILAYSTRTKTTDQGIITTSLQGNHRLTNTLTASWSGIVSQATNDQPDNARFLRNGALKNFQEDPQNVERRNSRLWLNNQDDDITGYLNFTVQPSTWQNSLIKTGGMYRNRTRDSYYNAYTFDPNPTPQVQGVNWNKYSDVTWAVVNPGGSATNELNFKAHENILAYYVLGKLDRPTFELDAGVRMEHTDQGYELKHPNPGQTADSSQTYVDVLPSFVFKYKLSAITNLRLTYFRGISRPGYFEIVPYRMEDDGYPDVGNPALRRVVADNFDIRWERFPNALNQILIGVFYKNIQDPIEYAVTRIGVNSEPVTMPNNFGTARNMGIELDVTHYFNKFGIRANYSYTLSRITSTKILRTRIDPNDPNSGAILKDVNQTRPLQGQAAHIGNLSLLYKNLARGWESQLSMVYTGERLEAISPFLDNDVYTRPIIVLDFTVEKRLSPSFDIFLKAGNLLNSTYQSYIKKPVYQADGTYVAYPYQDDPQHKTLVRKDQYYQSFRLGVRYQWNKNQQ